MQHVTGISCTLLLASLAFSCTQNRDDKARERSEQDPFPNSQTTIPGHDGGFQAGTMPSEHDEDGLRHQGRVVEEAKCPESYGPGQDVRRIDPDCPNDGIKPLVPLSTPTPSESAGMNP